MDRHARKNPNKVALIWEKDEPGQEVRVTYQELQDMASQIGNLLLDQGIKKGDIVADWDPYNAVILSEVGGSIAVENILENQTFRVESDEQTGYFDVIC